MAERRGETGKGGAPVRRRATGTRRAAEAPVLGDLLPGALELGLAVAATGAARVDDPGGEPAGEGEGDAAAPRRHARMSLSVEPHPLTRQHYRVNQDSAAQRELTLTYSLDGQHAEVRVTADRQEVVASGPLSDLLPSPQANDLLVVLGEEVNGRVRGRRWNFDSAVERTFSYGIPELLGRMGRPRGGKSYEALLETARRLARLRVGAKGGAGARGEAGAARGGHRPLRPARDRGRRGRAGRRAHPLHPLGGLRAAARRELPAARDRAPTGSSTATPRGGCTASSTWRATRTTTGASRRSASRWRTCATASRSTRARPRTSRARSTATTRSWCAWGSSPRCPPTSPRGRGLPALPELSRAPGEAHSAVYRVGRDAGAPAADRKLAPPAAGARAAAGAP
jgi:hypothetical protein